MIRDDFVTWMREHTTLAELSIQLYARIINKFKKKHKHKFSLDDVNKFISFHYRKKNCGYVKYAFKYYFEYLNRSSAYSKLVKVKQKSRKRSGVYLPRKQVLLLIKNIKNPLYRDVAVLQYSTGARGREILCLREEDVDLFYSDEAIKLTILGKGDRIRYSYLNRSFEVLLKKYLREGLGFLFLPDRFMDLDKSEFDRKVSSVMTYYYNAVRGSSESLGFGRFGTHDLRRNAAESFRKNLKDVYMVKQILGHSNINTTIQYFSMNAEDIKEGVLAHQRGFK